MLKKMKRHAGVIYIVAMTAVVAVILLCTDEWEKMVETVRSLRPCWAIAAGGCIALYVFLRIALIRYYLIRRGYRITWLDAAAVTGAGQFYSAVTPSSSGGQPMQVWELHRRGVPVSIGTACVSVKFIGFQMAVLLTGGLLWLLNRKLVEEQLYGFRWLVALGFAVNAALLVAIGLTVSHGRLLERIIRKGVGLGVKLRIVKNPQELQDKLCSALNDYCNALKSLLMYPLDMAVILILSLLQVLFYMSAIICIYHAFALEGTSSVGLLTMNYLLFISAAFVPLPGAAGAQEGGFCVFFRGMFPDHCRTAAMVCWRFFSYYLLMLTGLVMMAAVRTRNNHPASE